jgi:hypothetical protein
MLTTANQSHASVPLKFLFNWRRYDILVYQQKDVLVFWAQHFLLMGERGTQPEILGQLYKCTLSQMLGFYPLIGRKHQVQDETATLLCWSNNKYLWTEVISSIPAHLLVTILLHILLYSDLYTPTVENTIIMVQSQSVIIFPLYRRDF